MKNIKISNEAYEKIRSCRLLMEAEQQKYLSLGQVLTILVHKYEN